MGIVHKDLERSLEILGQDLDGKTKILQEKHSNSLKILHVRCCKILRDISTRGLCSVSCTSTPVFQVLAAFSTSAAPSDPAVNGPSNVASLAARINEELDQLKEHVIALVQNASIN